MILTRTLLSSMPSRRMLLSSKPSRRMLSLSSNAPIIVTKNAWDKLDKISKVSLKNNFLFAAKSGGCNGFNYSLTNIDIMTSEHNNSSKVKNDNLIVIVDPISEMLLLNTTIDYQDEDYTNEKYESKFLFIPDKNMATSCGCGVSFSPK